MKKPSLKTVFFVVLLDLIGFGIVLPLIPFYATEFKASSVQIGLLFSIYSLAQLFFSPLWGKFSDHLGRRPIMIMSTMGSFIAYTLFALSNSFALLFCSRLLAGIMGGNISTAQAYIADTTENQDRTKGMALIGVAFGIGFVLGPSIATILIHPQISTWIHHLLGMTIPKYAIPGYFAALMSFFSMVFVITKLPESLKEKKQSTFNMNTNSPFSKNFWQTIYRIEKQNEKSILPALLICVLLLSLAQACLYSAFPLYCHHILNFSARQVGVLYVYMGFIAIFIQGGLIRMLLKHFQEQSLFFIGCVIQVIGLALIPLSSSMNMLLLFLGLMSIGGSLNGPTIQSLVSKESSENQYGQIMGISQSMSGLGRVIGPTWGGFLFNIHYFLPFTLTALIVSWTFKMRNKLKTVPYV